MVSNPVPCHISMVVCALFCKLNLRFNLNLRLSLQNGGMGREGLQKTDNLLEGEELPPFHM